MKENKKSGKMEQIKDQSRSSKQVISLLNNQRDHVPVILIVGQYSYKLSR